MNREMDDHRIIVDIAVKAEQDMKDALLRNLNLLQHDGSKTLAAVIAVELLHGGFKVLFDGSPAVQGIAEEINGIGRLGSLMALAKLKSKGE